LTILEMVAKGREAGYSTLDHKQVYVIRRSAQLGYRVPDDDIRQFIIRQGTIRVREVLEELEALVLID